MTVRLRVGYPVRVTAAPPEETTVLAWRIHRLAQEPGRIALIAGGYALAFVLWWVVFPHPLAFFLPAVALTSALAEFLFPIEYRLTTRGAYAHNGPLSRLFLSWEEVRRATRGAEGVFLSPLRLPSRLDAFRGIRLRFAGGNDEAVIEAVRQLWRGDEGER